MKFSHITAGALAGSMVAAAPQGMTFTEPGLQAAIEKVAPQSLTCNGAPKPEECRTAEQASLAIGHNFMTHNITTPGEKAAVISTIAFESGEFKYQRNYYPGRPGQGTRNMQMIDYNIKYVLSFRRLWPKAAKIAGVPVPVGIPPAINAARLSDDQKNQIRDMLLHLDVYDFGSAVWFLTTQCKPEIRRALQSGTKDAFNQYVTSCIKTTMTDERQAYWNRAVEALK